MKPTIQLMLMYAILIGMFSCKKDKQTNPATPEPTPNQEELITTFKLILTDSATNTKKVYMCKDPDGPGGQAAFYGPDNVSQSDSLIILKDSSVYFSEIVLLDETKTPVDTISKEVMEEGQDHMFFYNASTAQVIQSANPYTLLLNPAGVYVRYQDLDSGNPQRGIGLHTRWKTMGSSGSAMILNITLKHQPGVKDGSYAPGEADISVNFKLQVSQ